MKELYSFEVKRKVEERVPHVRKTKNGPIETTKKVTKTIKNKITGLNISSLVCESGVIKIDLQDDDGSSVMDFTTSGCCLESVDESPSLDDNTTVSFSYYFPIIK